MTPPRELGDAPSLLLPATMRPPGQYHRRAARATFAAGTPIGAGRKAAVRCPCDPPTPRAPIRMEGSSQRAAAAFPRMQKRGGRRIAELRTLAARRGCRTKLRHRAIVVGLSNGPAEPTKAPPVYGSLTWSRRRLASRRCRSLQRSGFVRQPPSRAGVGPMPVRTLACPRRCGSLNAYVRLLG